MITPSAMSNQIPFNSPSMIGSELSYISEAVDSGWLAGDGCFTDRCHEWLTTHVGGQAALLTHSCTAALEMSVLLADVGPGDEVILPSFAFVSAANAIVLRGGVPVFVDIRADTLNIDATRVAAAITERTRAIMPIHYAGVCAEMSALQTLAERNNLVLIEDAAQALGSKIGGRAAGTMGHFGCFSFHETKNIIAGEGGALIVNDPAFVERAEIIREKGTNRTNFFRGLTDKYTWVDLGSSYLPSELVAAFLFAQLEHVEDVTARRLAQWNGYHEAFADLERNGRVRRPIVPDDCDHNGHLYYLLLPSDSARDALIADLKAQGIAAPFHYVPLHSAPAGLKYARVEGDMSVTDDVSSTLLRLPLYWGLAEGAHQRVIDAVRHALT